MTTTRSVTRLPGKGRDRGGAGGAAAGKCPRAAPGSRHGGSDVSPCPWVCVCVRKVAWGQRQPCPRPRGAAGRAAAGPAPVPAAAAVPPPGTGIVRLPPPGEVKFQEESCSTGIKWLRPVLRHGELF